MKTPTDEQLLVEHLAGKPDAFELLVRRYSLELYRFVLRFTNNSVAADDVLQEAFIQIYQSAASFDQSRRLRPWMFSIAANKARDWLRKRARRGELALDAQIDGNDDGDTTFADLLSADAPEDPADLQADEKREFVQTVLDRLPDALREALVLAYYHKLPYKEIAEILQIPVGTVKSRLHSAVGKFATAYQDAVEGQGGPSL